MAASLCACGAASGSSASQTAASEAQADSSIQDNSSYYSAGLDDNGFFSGLKASDYVTLPADIDSLTVSQDNISVDEATVDTDMQNLSTNYGTLSEVTDRAAQSGDTVNIDYTGTVDGVEFTGGTSTDYDLVLGSGSFIDGFEDQLIGHNKGDKLDVTVTFPDGYGSTTDANGNDIDLSNKQVVFAVTINSISESTLTDSAIATAFGDTYTLSDGSKVTTAEQARQYFEEQEAKSAKDAFVQDYLVKNSTVKDLPSSLMDAQKEASEGYVKNLASSNSTTESQILSQNGYDSFDDFWEATKDDVNSEVTLAIIIQAYAETHNITVTTDDIESAYGVNYQNYISYYGKGYVSQTTLKSLVTDSIMAKANIS